MLLDLGLPDRRRQQDAPVGGRPGQFGRTAI